MPVLETERLLIRPFTLDDLDDIHRILDIELEPVGDTIPPENKEARRAWLDWTVANYDQLALLYQPPYGDRAIALRRDGRLIGACGLVPALGPFDRLTSFGGSASPADQRLIPAVGLYYAVSPAFQGKGYATEAARALIDFGFQRIGLKRIVAMTMYDNPASMAVMRRLGMIVERNPVAEPPWFQVVGVIENER
jgi:RimJ/RimL family protein N-acetyltransferase